MYQSIDDQNNACDHVNIKIEHLHFGFYLPMIAQR